MGGYDVGEWVRLKQPEKGYRNVEVISLEGSRVWVRASSGWEFSVWDDEIEGAAW